MAETKQNRADKVKTLTVPVWAISVGRFVGTVAVTLALGYSQFVTAQNDIAAMKQHGRDSDVRLEAAKETLVAMATRLSTLEVKQTVVERDLSASLQRIESTIKDVQADVKDLQKTRGK